MEPITTSWILTTLLGGWLGNRGDYWLCKGANALHKRITITLHEPSNQQIQRAVRKSYLKATLMAVDHIQKQRSRISLTDRSWKNLEELKDYITEQIKDTQLENAYYNPSVLDSEHREILFPKEGEASGRMPELIQNFKESIINELEGGRRRVEIALKDCIMHGWKEGSKAMDFYRLTCAFFTRELNENPQLSNSIQTDYLDYIASEIDQVSLQMGELLTSFSPFLDEYRESVSKLNDIIISIEALQIGQGKIINELPEKTASLVLEKINEGIITARQISISEEYQTYVKDIQGFKDKIESIHQQLEGVKLAMNQVNNDTQKILEKNIYKLETELLKLSTQKETKENELNAFVSSVIQLAQQFKHSFTVNSERLQKAKTLFEAGKYQELNELLNEEEIDRDIEQFKEKGRILGNELIIKAQTIVLTKEKGWFEEADRLFSKALSIVENYDTTFDYAYFLAEHKQILRAITLYECSLKYISDDSQRANILNNLGVLQSDKNDFDNAEISYQEALLIRRQLAQVNPPTYLPDVATTLNNLGVLQQNVNDFENAEISYQEALQNYRQLAQVNPHTYLPYVAGTLNNLGNLQQNVNDFENAEISYKEALQTYRQLAQVNPHTYLPYVAGTLNNLGNLQRVKNDFENAEISYKEALQIRRQLAQVNPHTYLPYVAGTLNNLGILQQNVNDFENAEISYKEALQIRRQLAQVNPQTYLPDVAGTLNNLGNLQQNVNDFENAEISYKEALQTYRQLAQVNPHTYLPYVAMTLNNLGILQSDKNDFDNAEISYLEALQTYRQLAQVNPQTYLPYVAMTLNNLGNLQRAKNDFDNAEISYLEALQIRKSLADVQPLVYAIAYAKTLISLAIFYKASKVNKPESIKFAQEAIHWYGPFRGTVPEAEKWANIAEGLLVYWDSTDVFG